VLTLLFKLLIGHAVCDFALQSEQMARGKSRHYRPPLPPGIDEGRRQVVWPYWLGAHALIHAGAVWLLTGDPVLGVLEAMCHWLIDYAKCDGLTGIHTDQFLHVACKVAWAWVVVNS